MKMATQGFLSLSIDGGASIVDMPMQVVLSNRELW